MIGKTNSQTGGAKGEKLNISLVSNQTSHTDLIGAIITVTHPGGSTDYTWGGSEITVNVPSFVDYTVSYSAVNGYKTPEPFSSTAVPENSRSITAEYKTEIVSVSLKADNGSSVNGARVTINGQSHTWNGTVITQKVPFGTVYSVVPQALSGFGTPESQSGITAGLASRSFTFTYISALLKLGILSNQGADNAIAQVKALVKFGDDSVEMANGDTIVLPVNSNVTIIFPEVEGYKTPEAINFAYTGGVVEKSGTYYCEALTVNVSADEGSPSGYEVTVYKGEPLDAKGQYIPLSYIESVYGNYQSIEFNSRYPANIRMEIHGKATSNIDGCMFGGESTNDGPLALFFNYLNSTIEFRFAEEGYSCPGEIGVGEEFWITISGLNCHIRVWDGLDERTYSVSAEGDVDWDDDGWLGYINFFCFRGDDDGFAEYEYHTCYRLYSAKIYNGDTLIHDYVPCKNLSLASGPKASLYDKVDRVIGYIHSATINDFNYDEDSMVIGRQTTSTGTYKIPYDEPYYVQANEVDGYKTPVVVARTASAKSHIINQEYKIKRVVDLSMYDVHGNPIQQSTANCYVIKEPGQYKFPLVYGNAIKNGKVNNAAFTNNGGAYSHDFVNSNGAIITQPYIYPGGNNTVSVVNSDCDDNVISDVLLDKLNAYMSFTINQVPQEGGNIILQLKGNANGGYENWSWHIWLWPHDLTPVEITNATGVKYNIMPVNIASKYDADGVHIKNWFFQWGRHTPMLLPSAWNSTTDHTPGSITKTSKASNLATGLINPSTFYYNPNSPYNWFGGKSYYNLWDASCTGTGHSDNDTVKTVYDPCPVGWKIPNGNTFTGFSTSNVVGGFNNGWNFKRNTEDTTGVFFPASGYRKSSSGDLDKVGSSGGVWLSSASSQKTTGYLNILSSDIDPHSSGNRAYGFSVRPVEDDNIQMDVIMISFTIQNESYQAESGMTWFEWVNSEYNTGGYYVEASTQYVKNNNSTSSKVLSYNGLSAVISNENLAGGVNYRYGAGEPT